MAIVLVYPQKLKELRKKAGINSRYRNIPYSFLGQQKLFHVVLRPVVLIKGWF